jgi:hypothetical protein
LEDGEDGGACALFHSGKGFLALLKDGNRRKAPKKLLKQRRGDREMGRRQKAEGRRQKAEGSRQKAEGRRQKAEGRRQ